MPWIDYGCVSCPRRRLDEICRSLAFPFWVGPTARTDGTSRVHSRGSGPGASALGSRRTNLWPARSRSLTNASRARDPSSDPPPALPTALLPQALEKAATVHVRRRGCGDSRRGRPGDDVPRGRLRVRGRRRLGEGNRAGRTRRGGNRVCGPGPVLLGLLCAALERRERRERRRLFRAKRERRKRERRGIGRERRRRVRAVRGGVLRRARA